MIYYNDPTKPSVSKKVYKAFSNAKDANDNPLFSTSELKCIQDAINDAYNQNSKNGKSSVQLSQYKVDIVLNVKEEQEKSKAEEEP